jgi:hypothetical protein
VHLAFADLEVDPIESDDVAERLADRVRANRERPAGSPAGRRGLRLPGPRQFASELGM